VCKQLPAVQQTCCFQQHKDHRQEIHPAADPSAGQHCSKQKNKVKEEDHTHPMMQNT